MSNNKDLFAKKMCQTITVCVLCVIGLSLSGCVNDTSQNKEQGGDNDAMIAIHATDGVHDVDNAGEEGYSHVNVESESDNTNNANTSSDETSVVVVRDSVQGVVKVELDEGKSVIQDGVQDSIIDIQTNKDDQQAIVQGENDVFADEMLKSESSSTDSTDTEELEEIKEELENVLGVKIETDDVVVSQ